MEGMVTIEKGLIIRWVKSEGKWKIQLVKEEDNPNSDGHTNLIKETVLEQIEHE